MNKYKKFLKLLYLSFDGRLKKKEQKILAQALDNYQELRREKEQIEAQRKAVANSSVQTFNPFFVERVMARINALEGKPNGLDRQMFYDSLVSVFRKVALVGVGFSIVMFIYNLGIGESLPLQEVLTISDLTLQEILAIL